MLRFHRFHVPAAAERPAYSVSLSILCGCCVPEYTDTVSFSYAHGRYVIIGCFLVSRVTGDPRIT